MITPIKIANRVMKPHKASQHPDLTTRNVLTSSHWDFVELWLKRHQKENALFYWNQAKVFNRASIGLPSQSAPLLHYYSFMNATKALLSSRDVEFNPRHGVSPDKSVSDDDLENTGVKIAMQGIAHSLLEYTNDSESRRVFKLRDLFYNLPCIHRTYCLTYQIEDDLFLPIKNAQFVHDTSTNKAYFIATLSKDFSYDSIANKLPECFTLKCEGGEYIIVSTYSIDYSGSENYPGNELDDLSALHNEIRKNLFYINGAETLWYVKGRSEQSRQIALSPLTLTLVAMHRLSELSRYNPLKLNEFLGSHENWLLSEFIQQSPSQFIDEISSEITGHQFLIPNIRAAK